MEDDNFGMVPLLNAEDVEILMHRDAHFGSNFNVMIDYYNQDGIGVMPDFDLERIHYLKEKEEEMGEDLSINFMPFTAKGVVDHAKKLYVDLRSVYEEDTKGIGPLISDLILTESEEPEAEISALLPYGEEAAKALLHLLTTDSFFDPLFPGYGRAPTYAAAALAKMKYEKAIPFLFTAIGQDNFFVDEALIQALVSFGKPAKEFLLKRLRGSPYTKDNETAIIALSSFEEDSEIARQALELLEDPQTFKHEAFAIYLVFACSSLKEQGDRHRFKAISHLSHVPRAIKAEMEMVIKHYV